MNEDDGKTAGQGPEPDGDDQDLAALFNTGDKSPPELLSARILAAAHEAVSADHANDDAQVKADEANATVTRLQRWQTSGRWMAMAASVLLAVTLVPVLMRSPDSAMESDAIDSSRMKAVQESLSMSADSVAPAVEADLSEPQAGAQLQREAAPMSTSPAPVAAPSASMMPAIQARKRSVLADGVGQGGEVQESVEEEVLSESERAIDEDAGSIERETAVDEGFRDTPQSWVERIRQLEADGRYEDAVVEYEMFRGRYPGFEPGFSGPLVR